MPYNPFDVLPGEPLKPTDLQKLIDRSVSEGYFVEYKSIPPANEKMGRSIASFANTYGGWYIVGVTTDSHNVATAIPGFDPTLCPDPIARVREVIKTHISPSPMFFAQVVTLAGGNLVFVVYVPEGQDSPFISRDGRIYRRRHDSSDPIPETDRYAIDRLVEQGRRSREVFAEFCRDTRTISTAEKNRRWVGLYIQPYPPGSVDRSHKMRSMSALEDALALSKVIRTLTMIGTDPADHATGESSTTAAGSSSQSESTGTLARVTASGNIPFSSGILTTRSIILRQAPLSQAGINAHITVELLSDGSAKFFFELPDANPLPGKGGVSAVKSDSVRKALNEYLREDTNAYGITLARFVDTTELWATVALLVTYYQAWLGDEPSLTDVKVALSLSGVWRTVAFIDADEWAEYVRKYGLPILHQDAAWVPPDVRRADTFPYNDRLWLGICGLLQLALGLPYELIGIAMMEVAARQAQNLPQASSGTSAPSDTAN